MKKKGFTLIELLAVIVILAVIALIVSPIVTGIINESKKNVVKLSAQGYIKAVEQQIALSQVDSNYTSINDGEYSVLELESLGVLVGGKKPSDGNVVVLNGEVDSCLLLLDEYSVICNDNFFDVIKTSDSLNPRIVMNTNDKSTIDTGDKICINTECFYVISNNNGTIRMLSEWNLNVGYDYSYNGLDYITYGDFEDREWSYDGEHKGYIFSLDGLSINSVNKNLSSYNRQSPTSKGYTSEITLSDRYFMSDEDAINKKVMSKSVVNFSPQESDDNKTGYWEYNGDYETIEESPFVYNSSSNLYEYIENYVDYLKNITHSNEIKGTLITLKEIYDLGCSSSDNICENIYYVCKEEDVYEDSPCLSAGYRILLNEEEVNVPKWVYQTSYWTGTALSSREIFIIHSIGLVDYQSFFDINGFGVRPVIEIPESLIK